MNRDLSLFLGQLIRRPHEIVALAPSSGALARTMCEGLSPNTGRVAELGPGTGKITRAIVGRGIPPSNVVGFELNSSFCDILREEFPTADIRNTGAQSVGNLAARSLGAVISGLPLLSLPTELQRQIVGGSFNALQDGGEFVQFTYGPVPPIAHEIREELGLRWTVSAKIWGNLPPARVYRFRAQSRVN